MKIVAIVLATLSVGYLAYLGLLYLSQDSMVFPGRGPDAVREKELATYYPDFAALDLTAPDGTFLSGFVLERRTGTGPAPTLLYFGGNAEEVSGFFLWTPRELPGLTLVAVNYRGYGRSGGKPSEAALKADALFIYDAMKERQGRDTPVAVMGRSLGTGLAAHVAARRDPAGVILVTPYDSLAAVGQGGRPLVPVRLLMRHPFDVLAEAPDITAPTLILAASDDRVVPAARAEALRQGLRAPTRHEVFIGANHDSISDSPRYWPIIAEFLSTLPDMSSRAGR